MKDKMKALWSKVEPIHSMIIFMVILFTSNFVWKMSISGDEGNTQVMLFNTFDISAPFNFMVQNIVDAVKALLTMFNFNFHHHSTNDICFHSHNRISIIWGCTAIKQSFIFLCIMSITSGPWKHKLWYLPLGLLIIYLFNILRIFVISMVVENHPEYFHILHEEILKYVFYGVIFLVWMIWEEKFNLKKKKKTSIETEKIDSF